MTKMRNAHILEKDLDVILNKISELKLINNYSILETENHTNILFLYSTQKQWDYITNGV